MYSSLAQFKEYLWITWTDQDAYLTELLNSACSLINKLCGVDSFEEAVYEEEIDARWIYVNSFWYNIFLKNKPVQEIQEMNGTPYTWTKGADYMIANDRRLIIKNLEINDFWFLMIKYKAWYKTQDMPDDLKIMELMLASGKYQSKGMEWVQSYRLWDETITFGAPSGVNADDVYFSFRIMIDKYKNFNLAL